MNTKRYLSIGIFIAAILVVGGLVYATFGRPAAVVADESAAAEGAVAAEDAQPTSVILAGVEYPINEYGLSYGDFGTVWEALAVAEDQDVNDELEFDDLFAYVPDLISAATNEGEQGYMLAEDFLMQTRFPMWMNAHKDELNAEYGSLPTAALALDGTNDVVTIYAADGTTEIGRQGYANDEAIVETKKYEDEWEIYIVTTRTYPDGTTTYEVGEQVKEGAPGIPIEDIEAGLWPLSLEQIMQLPEVEE